MRELLRMIWIVPGAAAAFLPCAAAGASPGPPADPAGIESYLESRQARIYYSWAHLAAVEASAPAQGAELGYACLAGAVHELAIEALRSGPRGSGEQAAREAILESAGALLDPPARLLPGLAAALMEEGASAYRANYLLYRAWQAGAAMSDLQRRLFAARADAMTRIDLGRALLEASAARPCLDASWEETRQKLLQRLESIRERLSDAEPALVFEKADPILSEALEALGACDALKTRNGRVLATVRGAHDALRGLAARLRAAVVVAPGADMARSGHYRTAGLRELKEVWFTHKAAARLRGQPVVRDGTVYYAASGRFQWDGAHVVALDVVRQEPIWSFEAPARCFSVTLVGDRLYVSCSDVGTTASYLCALDAERGGGLWVFEAPQGPANALSHPAVDESGVFLADRWGFLYCLDAESGELRWTAAGGRQKLNITPTPALFDGTVYLPQPGQIDAIDASSGQMRWRAEVTVGDAEVAVADGRLYFCHRGVYAMSLKDRRVEWMYEPEERSGMFRGCPAVADGMVFARDGRTLYAVDAATGEERWRLGLDQPLDWKVSPVVAGGVVYVGTEGSQGAVEGSTVYAIDAATGQRLWAYDAGSPLYGSAPVVADGVVYVAADRAVTALR